MADQLLSNAQLAEYIGVPIATVRTWRFHGKGPAGFRVGGHVKYRLSDVDEWLDEQRRNDPMQKRNAPVLLRPKARR